MKHLAVAATLAVAIHVVLFRVQMPWTRPGLSIPRSQAVDISLVTFQPPVEKPAPPQREKPRARPGADRLQPKKPAVKPVVRPRPLPRAVQPEPAPQPLPVKAGPASEPSVDPSPVEPAREMPTDHAVVSDAEHAAVRVSVPLYDLNPPPVYPRVARRRNYQGTVLLDVRVTADGKAAEVKLARSSGYSLLDQSALTTVRTWRFEPARRGALPIETWVQVPVRFELK